MHRSSGVTLRVEAKGETSTKPRRFGQPFNPRQCKAHVAVAFCKAVSMSTKHGSTDERVGIALPVWNGYGRR